MTKFRAIKDVTYNGVFIKAGALIRINFEKLKNCPACAARRKWLAEFFKEIK